MQFYKALSLNDFQPLFFRHLWEKTREVS